jgi:D-alanyl-D-alanine dipeptidase
VTDVDPTVRLDIRYAGSDNFLGRPVDGYEAPRCLLSEPAARALSAVQTDLRMGGFSLLVFDCYRPQRAVDQFLRWAGEPADPAVAQVWFPRVAKSRLVSQGYIAARSAHTRGSTVDVTVVQLDSWGGGQPLDMGTSFDFFDPRSRTESTEVSTEARANRRLLRDAMARRGFRNLPQEWWHYTLDHEPYPNAAFDVPIR